MSFQLLQLLAAAIEQVKPDLATSVGIASALFALVSGLIYWVTGRLTDAIKEVGVKLDQHGAKVEKLHDQQSKMVNAMLLEVLTRNGTPPNVRAKAEQMLGEK